MTDNKSAGWQNVRRKLGDWSKPALIALVKDLYEVSPGNRDFLHARFQAEADDGADHHAHVRRIFIFDEREYYVPERPELCVVNNLERFLFR